ncbi:MAG: anhydro-N-acetylmuramic acid kinase [Planctomycetota bacterium]
MAGGDICVCNLVLDRLARDRLGKPFDEDGMAALTGAVSTAVAARLSNRLKPDHERSLGTGDEARWFDDELALLSPTDCLATACDAIARTIASQLPASDATIIAGGGSCNRALTRSFASHHNGRILESDAFGVPSQMREAVGFAVLGGLADDGIPVTIPAITGSVTKGRDGQWILS